MAITSASFVSPVLRCSRDVTSFGGIAVPTFQVTTVMLGRTKEEQTKTGVQKCFLFPSPQFNPQLHQGSSLPTAEMATAETQPGHIQEMGPFL